MTGVKRVVFMLDGCVHCEPLSSAWDHLPRYVLASNYDKLECLVEAVAVTRENEDGELCLDWLLEGGISALEFAGTTLLVAHGQVTDDTGSGEVYAAQPATGVIVPRELLEAAIERIELHTHFPFGEPQTPRDAENRRVTEQLRALLAQSQGVKP